MEEKSPICTFHYKGILSRSKIKLPDCEETGDKITEKVERGVIRNDCVMILGTKFPHRVTAAN